MARDRERDAANAGAGAAGRARRGPARVLAFSLLPTLLLFGTLEAGLRLAGFEFHGIPTHLRFGPNLRDDMERDRLVPDPELFWRLRVDGAAAPALGARRLYLPAAAAGGRLPAGDPAVVVLGDSCSFFGSPPWPEGLEARLRAGAPGAAVWNAAVPGYSSHQGRRLLEGGIAALRPDWVVAYFGWNDHWLGLETTDRRVAAGRPPALAGAVPALEGLRVVQAGRALRARLATPPPERRPLRVPPGEYRENLAAICRVAAAGGARVALVTAPAELDAGDASRLAAGGYAVPGADLAALHEGYNAIVREVAASCGATLVDFAAEAPPGAVGADGIHLTPAGAAWLADRVAAAL